MTRKILVTLLFFALGFAMAVVVSAEEELTVRKTVIVQKGKNGFTIIRDKKSIEIMEKIFPHGRKFADMREDLYCSMTNGFMISLIPGKCK